MRRETAMTPEQIAETILAAAEKVRAAILVATEKVRAAIAQEPHQ